MGQVVAEPEPRVELGALEPLVDLELVAAPVEPHPYWAIWMRLPHVSSNTAVVTGPISAGS